MDCTWRWFGPDHPVPLRQIRQAEPSGVATGLTELRAVIHAVQKLCETFA